MLFADIIKVLRSFLRPYDIFIILKILKTLTILRAVMLKPNY